MASKKKLLSIVNEIIQNEYYDFKYIPLQVLHMKTCEKIKARNIKPPTQREFYSLIRTHFEVVNRSILAIHTNYKPTKDNPIPLPWLRDLIKLKAKNKDIISESEVYTAYLEAAEAEAAPAKNKHEFLEAIKKAGYKIITGQEDNLISLL